MPAKHEVRGHLTLRGDQWRQGMSRAARQSRALRDSVVRHGRRMAQAFALAGAAAAAAIIKVGVDFEQAMANIGAVSNATAEQMERLERRARQLGATTAFSATQVAEGMTILAKAGLTVEENISAVEAVLKLAGSEMGDMAQAAELIVGTSRAMGIGFDQAARVANTFAAAAQNSQINIERLQDSMKFAAPVARDFGISFEAATAAVATLVDNGLQASQAGTALRKVLGELQRRGGQLGDEFETLDLRTESLADLMVRLAKAGHAGQQAYTDFDLRAASAVTTLAANADRLREVEKAVTSTNAAWKAYARQQDTTAGAWKRLRSALEEVAIGIFKVWGRDLKERLDDAAKWISSNVGTIQRWAVEHRKAIETSVALLRFYADYWGIVVDGVVEKARRGAEVASWFLPGIVNALLEQLKSKAQELLDAGAINEEALKESALRFADAMVGIEKRYQEALANIIDINAPQSRAARLQEIVDSIDQAKVKVEKLEASWKGFVPKGPPVTEIFAPFHDVPIEWSRDMQRVASSTVNVLGGAMRATYQEGATAAEKWKRIWFSVIDAVARELEERFIRKLVLKGFEALFNLATGKLPIPIPGGDGGSGTGFIGDTTGPKMSPQFRGSGPGGTVHLSMPVTIERGSLVLADDEASLRRWSGKLEAAAERGARRAYRELRRLQ